MRAARSTFAVSLLSLLLAFALGAPLAANTPYGYLANAGWIDFAPSAAARVAASDTHLQGLAYAANFGWINLGDGTPDNGVAYANNSATDFGVNHNGRGELSGYAYGANIGWINFSWAGANDSNRPRVDLVTGIASGFAYSANVGWIDLSTLTMPGVTASVRFPSGNPTQNAGGSVTLRAGAFGNEALTFQWLFNGVPIPGATSAILTLRDMQAYHAGNYSLVITRADGSTFTVTPGTLAVSGGGSTSRLLNLSTRGECLTGENVMIPGFVINGSAESSPINKRLLLRAVGPRLADLGVNGVLADPAMTLKRFDPARSSYVDVASNNDWSSNANAADIVATAARVGAFALEPDSRDAAMLLDLAPGQYTVVASGAADETGVGIVELYDADETAGGARLVNISTRGFVGSGDSIMIPGYIVSSEGAKTLLVRAIGPKLADSGVTAVLADPQLAIHTSVNNTDMIVASNDDWSLDPDAASTAIAAQQVGAFALDAGSKDAALVVTLQPGVYTVHASGVGGATGTALVEIYALP